MTEQELNEKLTSDKVLEGILNEKVNCPICKLPTPLRQIDANDGLCDECYDIFVCED